MKIHKFKNIEFAEVNLSALYNDRIDAEYYKPEFIRNAEIIDSKDTIEVKDLMYPPQYGLSIAMNEDAEGYKILKMDDIVGVLADDINAKYADISSKLFKTCELKKFDVLFNRVNSDDFVGRTGIYLLDGKHTFASYLVRVTSEHSYQNCYLTIFLNCKHGYNCLQRVKRRAVNQANINAQELKALKIPTPSVSFQKQIEKLVLESYEQKQQSESLYKEAEQILLQALGLENWQPQKRTFYINNVTFETEDTISKINLSDILLSNRLDSEHYKPKFDELETIVKANALYLKCIGDIQTFNSRGVQPDYCENGELNVINSKHILEKTLDYDNFERTSKVDWENKNSSRVLKNDILTYTTGANIGRTSPYLNSDKALASNHVNILRIKSENPIYVALVMNSIIGRFQLKFIS